MRFQRYALTMEGIFDAFALAYQSVIQKFHVHLHFGILKMQDLQLIDETSGNFKRAAILLFHPKPEKFVTGAYIKIGFFQDDDEDLAFQDEVHGSLMEQIDKAFDLLKSKYIVKHKQTNSDPPAQTNRKVVVHEKCWQKGSRILL